MSDNNGWDKVNDEPNLINPSGKGKEFNGTDPITPERAVDLLFQIKHAVEELVYGIEPVEKDETGFPRNSEGVMAIYVSAQVQELLGRGAVRAFLKDNFAEELVFNFTTPEPLDEDTDYLPSIADHYEEYPESYDKVVEEYLGVKKDK